MYSFLLWIPLPIYCLVHFSNSYKCAKFHLAKPDGNHKSLYLFVSVKRREVMGRKGKQHCVFSLLHINAEAFAYQPF